MLLAQSLTDLAIELCTKYNLPNSNVLIGRNLQQIRQGNWNEAREKFKRIFGTIVAQLF